MGLAFLRAASKALHWDVLPHLSTPSKRMNAPLLIVDGEGGGFLSITSFAPSHQWLVFVNPPRDHRKPLSSSLRANSAGFEFKVTLVHIDHRDPLLREHKEKEEMARIDMDNVQQDPPQDDNIFRSEDMEYVQLYIQHDAAHDSIDELGKLGCIEFVDLNEEMTAFQRPFVAEIKRCEEMYRKLRYFRLLVERDTIPIEEGAPSGTMSLSDVEMHIADLDSELREATTHLEELLQQIDRKKEYQEVLGECINLSDVIPDKPTPLAAPTKSAGVLTQSLLNSGDLEAQDIDSTVGTVCGTVPVVNLKVLDRVLFRVTRGNCVLQLADEPITLVDNYTGIEVKKMVFFVFFTSQRVANQVIKVVDSFQAVRFDFPPADDRQRLMDEITEAISELNSVVRQTTISRHVQLQTIARSLAWWEKLVTMEMAIFDVLNKTDYSVDRPGLVCEGWVPKRRMEQVRHALYQGSIRSGTDTQSIVSPGATKDTPPTYYHTNLLNGGFQAIVEAYGVADYLELNPSPFTVITFPFLFAVMFGDLGHGFMMFLFACYMLFKEKHFLANPPGEIFAICFGGRYVILLMSIFSMYAGLIYNETFSMAFDMFGSRYEFEAPQKLNSDHYNCGDANVGNSTVCVKDTGETYAFGVDPAWKMSTNELSFTNGLKMKMSIVFGVTHMTFGIMCSASNYIYFKKWVDLIHMFVPQILFLLSVFGYMVILILVKWSTDFNARDSYHLPGPDDVVSTNCAPSILNTFINMFISQSVEPVDNIQHNATDPAAGGCKGYGGDGALVSGQQGLQTFLLLLAFFSVPWMLLAKPLIERARHRKMDSRSRVVVELDEAAQQESTNEHFGEEEYDFTEEMVHNIIHTIEFVLGAVSNTASYLRLWALSLAHSQLGTVFWEKGVVGMLEGAKDKGAMTAVMVTAGMFVWIMCTVGVLMVMESLSAFLHALRLHWVEYQNKFYHGTGRKFMPFSFDTKREDD